jgi:site-specific DNA recombinase
MKKNVAYLRVSSDSQVEKYGLDLQRAKITEYCERKGVKIEKWYIDGGYSGAKMERPDITSLLHDAEYGEIGTVYIYKLDRMSRDVIDTLTLLYRTLPQYGVHVESVTEDLRFDNPMDKVMIGVNAIMGQYEREVILMRTKAGKLERVKKGYWMGGATIPIGYNYDRNDGILHPNDDAEKVKRAYELYLDGYSCEKISKILGFACERSVRQVLTHKAYLGMIEFGGNVYKGRHEPIITIELYNRVQECAEKRHTHSYVSNDNMLTGLCWCGVCGARMRYIKWGAYHKLMCYSQDHAGKEYMKRDENCNNIKPKAHEIENEVESQFLNFALKYDEPEKKETDFRAIEAEIKKVSAKVKKFYTLYVDNQSESLLELIQAEESRLKVLREQFKIEQSNENEKSFEKMETIKSSAEIWNELENKQKNKILKECIEKVIIRGDDVEIFFTSV